MASQKTKFFVGLFVACGISIALLALIWLGMSRFFEKGSHYVAYFNESVQGLDIDSPVKYRGVSIGRVESIGVAPDSKLIQVVLIIESGQTLGNDIVSQLKSVGITGSMFIELDRKKKGEPDLSPHLSFPTEYPVVSSKPSEISRILSGIGDVLNHIKSMDLKGISDKIKLGIDDVRHTISDANVKVLSMSLNGLMHDAERTMNTLETMLARADGIVSDKEETIKIAIDDFREAMKNTNIFLAKGSSLVSNTDDSISRLKRHILVVAQNLEVASENLNRLLELLADHPSQLMFGDPPTPREVGP